jgi:peptidoglycan hydrolase CwlO-like protein
MKKFFDIQPPEDYIIIRPQRKFSSSRISLQPKNFFMISILIFILFSFALAYAPIEKSNLLAQNNQNEDIKAKRESLEQELQKVLSEIKFYRAQIANLEKEKKTLANEIKYLESQIKKVELEIKAINLEIQRLNSRIADTKKAVKVTEDKIDKSKDVLGILIRHYYQLRQQSLVEVLLADVQISDYFLKINAMSKLQNRIKLELDNLHTLMETLQKQKQTLENELEEQSNLLSLTKIKESQLKELKLNKNKLLALKEKETSLYKEKLEEKSRTAAEIRAQIYRLAGGTEISFGEALDYATFASNLTGVRPALILAVLDYESKIGRNVGNCHYKDAMKPSEWPIFEEITRELGLDPNKMPVSCKPWYGWGGAMGPAQFLPSTWMKYKDEIAKLTGHNPPSPWNILDAFVAAALFLKKAGADEKNYSAEWKAAMIYFAGSNWSKPSLRFYGDDVMALAEKYEEDIKALGKSGG